MELLRDNNGEVLVKYLSPMNTVCIHCKLPVTPDDGMFMALSHPYYGVMHRWCAPFFNFNGGWPHPLPAQCYSTNHNSNPSVV